MLVLLKNTWFAPTEPIQIDKIRQIPEYLREHLPSSAIILDDTDVNEDVKKPEVNLLREADLARAGSMERAKLLEELSAEEELKKKAVAERCAKAREAKRLKKEAEAKAE
jgi:hypothetical protein